jgi:ATP-dependent RNA helicase DeaD
MFGDIPVSEPVERALTAMGYEEPSPIQTLVAPHLLQGRDLVGQAQTGTGKTAAFGIPIVEAIKDEPSRPGSPLAIVLCPTRELAAQVTGELTKLGAYAGVTPVAVYGGQSMNVQLDALQAGAQVVVATPGRLMDHMERRTIELQQVKIVILDEADQMLDIGFADDIERILRRTPKTRQTALFSATMPGPIKYLSRRYLNNPEWCRVGEESQTVDQVDQVYFEVASQDRQQALRELLKDPDDMTQALIFRRTKIGVDKLVWFLQREGYEAEAIHGDMTQAHRERTMNRFREKNLRILIATNVAARGLDIPAVSHVVNYDIPDNLEEYVHRIGRTARMGKEGTAYLFVSDPNDFDMLETIRNHVGEDRISKRRLDFLYGS